MKNANRGLGLVTSAEVNRIVGEEAIRKNCDGDTLKSALQQAAGILEFEEKTAICDPTCRSRNYEGLCNDPAVFSLPPVESSVRR